MRAGVGIALTSWQPLHVQRFT